MTRRLLLAILLLALARSAHAQIAFDQCTDASSTTATSQTFTHTPIGTPSVAFLGLLADPSSDVMASGTVTYCGTTMARVDMAGADVSARRLYIFFLLNPPAGACSIVVTPSTSSFLWSQAITYTGTTTGGSYDAKIVPAGNASATSFTTTLTPVADNSRMILAASDPQGVSAGTGSTARCGSGSFRMFDNNANITPPAATSMTVTGTPADKMYSVAVTIAPPSGGRRSLTLLGVGQ